MPLVVASAIQVPYYCYGGGNLLYIAPRGPMVMRIFLHIIIIHTTTSEGEEFIILLLLLYTLLYIFFFYFFLIDIVL